MYEINASDEPLDYLAARQRERVEAALDLYDVGLHVFPTPLGSKESYGKHGFLDGSRLWRPSFTSLFAENNVAVRTGRLSGNLFVLDCDTWTTFAEIRDALESRGICSWIRSGSDGGQFWMRCVEGEIENQRIANVDVLGNRLYTLAPPSIHPTGMVYEWTQQEGAEPPKVSIAALNFLGLALCRRKSLKEKRGALPPVADRVIFDGDISGYSSHSEAEYAACLSMISGGLPDWQIVKYFEIHAMPHFTKVGRARFEKHVLGPAHTWLRQREPMSSIETHNTHDCYANWASRKAWPGRTGTADRAVYLALCERMRMDGGMPFRASVREVAEIANINKATAQRAISRLVAAKLIKLDVSASRASACGAGMYRFIDQEGVSCDLDELRTVGEAYTPVRDSVRNSDRNHDVWLRGSLGKTAEICIEAIIRLGKASDRDITSATGKSLKTVRTALQRLAEYELIHQIEEGVWRTKRVSKDHLDEIARNNGTYGRNAHRISEHLSERQRYVTNLLEKQIELATPHIAGGNTMNSGGSTY